MNIKGIANKLRGLEFTAINYELCQYCKNLVRAAHDEYVEDGCGLRKNDRGQYARLSFFDGVITKMKMKGLDAVDSFAGCEKFSPNGMPAHPSVIESMVKSNEKARGIPADENAIETRLEFMEKLDKYIPRVHLYISFNGKIIKRVQ